MRPRAKGTAAETRVEAWLRSLGVDATRNPLRGARDCGDIALRLPDGRQGLVSVKDDKSFSWSTWLTDLERQMVNADAEVGIVCCHRPRRGSVGDWYAVQTMSSWAFEWIPDL